MSNREDRVLQALQSLPEERQLEVRSTYAFIRCPWHKFGKENTPSLRIRLHNGHTSAAGTWKCYGCAPQRRGVWSELAGKLNLPGGISSDDDEVFIPDLTGIDDNLIRDDSEGKTSVFDDQPFPKDEKWRGINGWLLHKLKTTIVFDDYGSRVSIPIMMHGQKISRVRCSWTKTDLSYLYDSTPEIVKALFPFDYIAKRLKKIKRNKRYVVLVEGPRDALNLIQNDIFALANLGGTGNWLASKAEELSEMGVQLVIGGFDPDKVGKELSKLAKNDLEKHYIPFKKFKMVYNKETGFKEDPGALSPKRIIELRRFIDANLKNI